jgi:hypothetical protein
MASNQSINAIKIEARRRRMGVAELAHGRLVMAHNNASKMEERMGEFGRAAGRRSRAKSDRFESRGIPIGDEF